MVQQRNALDALGKKELAIDWLFIFINLLFIIFINNNIFILTNINIIIIININYFSYESKRISITNNN